MKADTPVQKKKISKREKRTQELKKNYQKPQELRKNYQKPQDELWAGSNYIMQQLKIC